MFKSKVYTEKKIRKGNATKENELGASLTSKSNFVLFYWDVRVKYLNYGNSSAQTAV